MCCFNDEIRGIRFWLNAEERLLILLKRDVLWIIGYESTRALTGIKEWSKWLTKNVEVWGPRKGLKGQNRCKAKLRHFLLCIRPDAFWGNNAAVQFTLAPRGVSEANPVFSALTLDISSKSSLSHKCWCKFTITSKRSATEKSRVVKGSNLRSISNLKQHVAHTYRRVLPKVL